MDDILERKREIRIMFYVIKRGNEYNVVMKGLLKETDTILFKSPSAEVAWNECDKYSDKKETFSDYINKQIITQNYVKGDDIYGNM